MLTCETCGHTFRQTPGEERKTLQAAKANKQGPFCELCRHLEMALRYAQNRRLIMTAGYISHAQAHVTTE
jgi:rubredoxin